MVGHALTYTYARARSRLRYLNLFKYSNRAGYTVQVGGLVCQVGTALKLHRKGSNQGQLQPPVMVRDGRLLFLLLLSFLVKI